MNRSEKRNYCRKINKMSLNHKNTMVGKVPSQVVTSRDSRFKANSNNIMTFGVPKYFN